MARRMLVSMDMARTKQGSKQGSKIIWAVDAFEDRTVLREHAVDALRHILSRDPEATIEPVYVLTPAQLNLSIEFTSPAILEYRPAAQKALQDLCDELEIPRLLEPKVIAQNFSATSQAVNALSDYAYRTGARMIVLSSHGRSGISRLLLGSFAEALLLASKVPVLVVGPFLRKSYEFDHILYPTDFGELSESMFRRVVDFARSIKARITLFHAIPSPIEPVFQSGVYLLGGAWLPVHAYFSKETERHQRHAEIWGRWARRQGVPTTVVVDTKAANIADSIVALAKREKVGLIAMDAHSGPFSAALIGSITRQVVRNADCPVWVLRGAQLARTRRQVRQIGRTRRAGRTALRKKTLPKAA